MISVIFYKSGRWDFVVPPCAFASAATTITPDNDDDGGGGLTRMVAVGVRTVCITGAFREHVVIGGGSGGVISGNSNNADNTAAPRMRTPPLWQ